MPITPTMRYGLVLYNMAIDDELVNASWPVFGAGKWLLLGYTKAFVSTDDGVTWTLVLTLPAGYLFTDRPIWNGTYFLALAFNSANNNRYMYRSTDGTTWTNALAFNYNSVLQIMANPAGVVVVIPWSGTTGWRSTNHGASFGTITIPAVGVRQQEGCWNGAVFCISAGSFVDDGIMTSPTGVTWTTVATAGGTGTCVAYGSDIYSFGGNSAISRVSTDNGATWTNTYGNGRDPCMVGFGMLFESGRGGWPQTYRAMPPSEENWYRDFALLDIDPEYDNNFYYSGIGVREDTGTVIICESRGEGVNGVIHVFEWEAMPTIVLSPNTPKYIVGESIVVMPTGASAAIITVEPPPDYSYADLYLSENTIVGTDYWYTSDYMYVDQSSSDSPYTMETSTGMIHALVMMGGTMSVVMSYAPLAPFWTGHVNSEEV